MQSSARSPRLFVALVTLSLLLAAAAKIHAQTVINSLPYTISTPGDYVLGGNLTFNGNGTAITFAVGNVTLDFAGHYISGLGAGSATTARGFYANNRANITVQNGAIVGFFYGIYFDGSTGSGGNNTGNVITNMRLPSNTGTGIELLNPVTCRVEGCQVNKTGGTTVTANSNIFGIYVLSGSATLKNNQVSTVTPAGTGTGYGICGINSTTHFFIGNQVDTCGTGVYMDSGAGKRQDNLTAGCTTAFTGGVDAGGNN